MTALLVWIGGQTGLPADPRDHPVLTLSPQAVVCKRAYPSDEWAEAFARCVEKADVAGIYDFDAREIVLPEGWDPADIFDLSVLLHELVHHAQAVDGREYSCRGAMEKVAYDAQIEFLAALGIDFFEVSGMNHLYYVMLTSCKNDRY